MSTNQLSIEDLRERINSLEEFHEIGDDRPKNDPVYKELKNIMIELELFVNFLDSFKTK
jgi:hypothetical protein